MFGLPTGAWEIGNVFSGEHMEGAAKHTHSARQRDALEAQKGRSLAVDGGERIKYGRDGGGWN